MNKFPDFLIIGAMKCATSTLHEQLAVQNGIFMTELKEPNFFSNDDQYAKGMEWYLSHFESAPDSTLCGESSTHYTKRPTYPYTVKRIKQHLPNAKFIYIIRHPIDRLVSQYIHEWTQRRIFIDINQAIYQHPELVEYSRYSLQLQPYFETFGQIRVLPIFFERLFQYPQTELERICHFIGYREKPTWNSELNAQNISSERMQKNAIRDFLVEQPVLQKVRRQFIPKSFRTWVRSWWTLKKRPKLEPKQVDYLWTIFDPDLAMLGSWLGIELSCENFKATVKDTPHNWIGL